MTYGRPLKAQFKNVSILPCKHFTTPLPLILLCFTMFWPKHTKTDVLTQTYWNGDFCFFFKINLHACWHDPCFVFVFFKPQNDVKSSLLQPCLSSNYIHLNEFKLSFYTWFPSSVELLAFWKEKYIYFLLISFAAHGWTKLRKSQETIIHKHSPVNLKRFHAIDPLKRIGFFYNTLWKFRTDLIGSSFLINTDNMIF